MNLTNLLMALWCLGTSLLCFRCYLHWAKPSVKDIAVGMLLGLIAFAALPARADVALLPSGSTKIVSNVDAGSNIPVELRDLNGAGFASIEDGHMQVSQDMVFVTDRAVGTALNTNVWTGNVTTMTMDTLSGFYRLNASGITTLSTTAQLQTIKQHSVGNADLPVSGVAAVKVNNLPLANSTAQLGFFSASGTAIAPTDGCYFEWNAAAEFRAVTNANGAILQSGVLTNPSQNILHIFTVYASYDKCSFFVDGVLVADLPLANVGGVQPMLGPKLPYAARIVTSASAPLSAPSLQLGSLTTYSSATNWNKTAAQINASFGRAAYQSPLTTFTQTANWANSTSPTSATLSNTAAGYTTLGGRYQFATVAGAATDYALFGFQVPTGYQLVVTGIRISACNNGAAVATTATELDWGVGVNSSAVSLATADALGPPPTAWAPRRTAIDHQEFAVGAAVGACAPTVVHAFSTPLVVDSARFFHVILQMPVGTATATQVIRGNVTVEGYFE